MEREERRIQPVLKPGIDRSSFLWDDRRTLSVSENLIAGTIPESIHRIGSLE